MVLQITLPDAIAPFLHESMEQGHFASESDYVSTLVLAAQRAHEGARVDRLLAEGRESGFETPDAAYWERRRAELRRRTEGGPRP